MQHRGLHGGRSCISNKSIGEKTRIHFQGRQYIVYMWGSAKPQQEPIEKMKNQLRGNRVAILARSGGEGFSRQAESA